MASRRTFSFEHPIESEQKPREKIANYIAQVKEADKRLNKMPIHYQYKLKGAGIVSQLEELLAKDPPLSLSDLQKAVLELKINERVTELEYVVQLAEYTVSAPILYKQLDRLEVTRGDPLFFEKYGNQILPQLTQLLTSTPLEFTELQKKHVEWKDRMERLEARIKLVSIVAATAESLDEKNRQIFNAKITSFWKDTNFQPTLSQYENFYNEIKLTYHLRSFALQENVESKIQENSSQALYAAARKLYDEAQEIKSNQRNQFDRNLFDAVVVKCNESIKKESEFPSVYLLRGMACESILALSKNPKEQIVYRRAAIDSYDKCIQLIRKNPDPEFQKKYAVDYIRAVDFQAQLSGITRHNFFAHVKQKTPSIIVLEEKFARAKAAYEEGKNNSELSKLFLIEKSITLCNEIIEIDAGYSPAYLQCAKAHELMGDASSNASDRIYHFYYAIQNYKSYKEYGTISTVNLESLNKRIGQLENEKIELEDFNWTYGKFS